MSRFVCLLAVLALSAPLGAASTITVEQEGSALRGGPLHLKVTAAELPPGASHGAVVLVDGKVVHRFELEPGEQSIVVERAGISLPEHEVAVSSGMLSGRMRVRSIPAWLSIIPPSLAIVLALLFKDVLISLFLGVYAGALILNQWNPLRAFGRSIDSVIAPALANGDHVKIVIFSILLGGMVGLISKGGGTLGIVRRLSAYASTPRRGQVATWLMGIFIFFDDYANALIVGSTMRPITDRLRISREKLSYIVDSTAAPVASVFPISTWIGFEVGLIAAAFNQLHLPYNAYTTFIASIPFRFYPIFALVLGFTIAFACRDLGPMLRAELRASATGEVIGEGDVPLADYTASALAPPEGIPHRSRNAFIPIFVVIAMTIAGLFISGSTGVDRSSYTSTLKWVQEVFSNASSLDALLWASLLAVVVALFLPVTQGLLNLRQAMEAMVEGFKSMMMAIIVLVLAWSIGEVCSQLHTADYVVGLAGQAISPHFLPVLVFMIAAAISFATGTSWGTMAILMPLAIPIAHGLSLGAHHPVGSETYYLFMLGTISSVLAGSVWGDHCSPISDTTILSSMGSGCDHIAHVRTQLPYAFAIGVLGMLVGDIPTAFGLSPWFSMLIGTALIIAVVMIFGKRSDWNQAADRAAQ